MNASARLRPVCRRASFERGLDRLGAAVGEEDPLRLRARRQRRQPLGQPDLGRVVEVGPRHVDQPARLLADRRDDLGMAMPGVGHGDARREVEEPVAVHVLDHRPLRALHHQRIDARVRRRHDPLVALQPRGAPGPGSGPMLRFVTLKRNHHVSSESNAVDCVNTSVAVLLGIRADLVKWFRFRVRHRSMMDRAGAAAAPR